MRSKLMITVLAASALFGECIPPKPRSTAGTIATGAILIGATTGAEAARGGGLIFGSRGGAVAESVIWADAERHRAEAQAYEACVWAQAQQRQAEVWANAQMTGELARANAEVEKARIEAGVRQSEIGADLIKSGADGNAQVANGQVGVQQTRIPGITVNGKAVYRDAIGDRGPFSR